MATPPTRVTYQTPAVGYGSTASPKTTPTFDVVAGDLITLIASSEDSPVTLGTPSATGGSITWTLLESVVVSSYCTMYLWKGVVGATATGITVSVSRTASTLSYSFGVTLWRNHGGVGVHGQANIASGAPSLALTTSANSAVSCGSDDWTASDGTTRTWRTVNGAAMTESLYFRNSLTYTVYSGFAPDTGAAGTTTVGLTVPSAQKYSIVGIEVLGTSSGSNLTASPADSEGITDALTSTNNAVRSQSDPVGITDSAAAANDAVRAQSDPVGLTDAVTANSGAARSPGDPVGLTDTLSVTWDRATVIADPVGVTDAPTTANAAVRSVADGVGVTDTASSSQSGGSNLTATPADPVGITDALTAAWDRAVTITDGVGVTDPYASGNDAVRAASDPLGVTDSLTSSQSGTGAANLADPVGLTDTVSVVWDRVQTVADFLNLTDTPTTDHGSILADPEGITDSTSWTTDRTRGPSDTVGLTDTVTAVLDRVAVIADTVGLVDAEMSAGAAAQPRDLNLTASVADDRYHATLTTTRYAAALAPDRYQGELTP